MVRSRIADVFTQVTSTLGLPLQSCTARGSSRSSLFAITGALPLPSVVAALGYAGRSSNVAAAGADVFEVLRAQARPKQERLEHARG